ncbi:MAG: hypothetical protein IPK17_35655 [Chloroflexi bacterium]|uniref:hypothetical protein n=1 Tax=Candidatus Flexifilum breve TaxID=3140694 RepID=UPI003134A617|nr:hypothetical protein [Chloroflexota bacterium]
MAEFTADDVIHTLDQYFQHTDSSHLLGRGAHHHQYIASYTKIDNYTFELTTSIRHTT